MSRVFTTLDIEELARAGSTTLHMASGDIISPAAIDLARARGIDIGWGSSTQQGKQPDPADHEVCSCRVEETVESELRSVIRQVAASRPDADVATVAAETLRLMGAPGPTTAQSAEQAQPREGRLLPAKSKGARPDFFGDGGTTDAVIAVVTALASELWAARQRLDTLERVLAAKGTIAHDAIDAYQPEGAVAEEQAQMAAEYVTRVFRVFEQMRESIVSGETWDDYMDVVRRAYAQL